MEIAFIVRSTGMLLLLLPATVEGRFYWVLWLMLALLPAVVWGARLLVRPDSLSKRRGVWVLTGVLALMLGLWWWVLQTPVVVAGWHTVVH